MILQIFSLPETIAEDVPCHIRLIVESLNVVMPSTLQGSLFPSHFDTRRYLGYFH
jgi:hypothetical protein